MKAKASTPSRLHLGDIDPYGVGRFGYAPILAIDRPRTIVEAAASNSLEVSGLEVEESKVYAERILKAFSLPGAKVKVLSTAPRHVGFGSTTSLSLSIGKAITLAHGMELNSMELVEALRRTSTGGLYTFQHGGFVVAGGLKVKPGEPVLERRTPLIPPLIFRADFPENWRFIVVKPTNAGVSPFGDVEEGLFRRLRVRRPPIGLIHEAYFTLMSKLVPSVIDEDAEAFGDALTKIQLLVGRIYQQVQGGVFNPSSAWVIPILHGEGAMGVGQSSWGPVVYAFADNEEKALEIERGVRERLRRRAETFIVKADNSGAETKVL